MRRLCTYFLVGSIVTAGGSAIAGGLPENNSGSAATAGSTAQATSAPAAPAAAETAPAAPAQTNATQTSSSTVTETASSVSDEGVETGSFVAIEDDPLIIDASSVVDGDGVGSMQVQWQISDNGQVWSNLSGEIRQSFTPRERHVGRLLRVQLVKRLQDQHRVARRTN